MSLALIHPSLRAAVRERLLTCVDIDHSPGVSVALASGVFTRASGSWLDAGFASGMEVSVAGFAGSPLIGQVSAVSTLALTTNIAGTQTVPGGGEFIIGLPQGRAWEGFDYFPTSGVPYIAESYRPNFAAKRSVGNPDGTGGTIEHRISAGFTLFYPNNHGTNAIERMAGALMSLFRPSVSLSRAGCNARVQSIQAAPLYADGGWIAAPVTATLLAFTQN